MRTPQKNNPGFAPWLGVFETLRVNAGVARFVDEHWELMSQSARVLNLSLPRKIPSYAFKKQTGRWRWILDPQGFRQLFVVEADSTTQTFSASISPVRVGSQNWDALHKTVSYLAHWQARQSARTDEAILLNENGHMASGAMSNLFWVIRGKVFTPAHRAGCRQGVVRQWIKRQLKVTETLATPDILKEADEIFISNSWIGIRPITKISGKKIGIGAITEKLQHLYLKDI